MARKLYSLRNVPDDEADEMRSLLQEHDVDFHETSAGFLGIGTAAIWVKDETQFDLARDLIADYQAERYNNAREAYLRKLAEGTHTRFSDIFMRDPWRIFMMILFALFLILLTVLPFFL